MASDLARCLVTREGVRPGQEAKWPRWIARRNVEGFGLKAQAWRKEEVSRLLLICWMALWDKL